jgi:hypothetical protein
MSNSSTSCGIAFITITGTSFDWLWEFDERYFSCCRLRATIYCNYYKLVTFQSLTANTLAKTSSQEKREEETIIGLDGRHRGGGRKLGASKPHELAWVRTRRSNQDG